MRQAMAFRSQMKEVRPYHCCLVVSTQRVRSRVGPRRRMRRPVRVLTTLRNGMGALRNRALRAVRADPGVVHYAAKISVWVRWFIWLAAAVAMAYRQELWYHAEKPYLLLHVPLVAFNGFLHYRLHTNRTRSRGAGCSSSARWTSP